MQKKTPTPHDKNNTRTLVPMSELCAEFLTCEIEQAKEAGETGYMARAFVLSTLPHRRLEESVFARENGFFRLVMMSDPKTGLPFGTIPRLLLSYVTTEAVRTRSLEVELGSNLSEFLRRLGMVPTGGRWGSITRVKTQAERLFSCAVTCRYEGDGHIGIKNVSPVSEAHLAWDLKRPDQASLWRSTVRLSDDFGREIMYHPVPYQVQALRALTSSSMAMDLYLWISYRNSYIKRPSHIPWEALQMQFGAGYPFTAQGKRNFKRKLLGALKKVCEVYPDASKLRPETSHLFFVPGRPHILPKPH